MRRYLRSVALAAALLSPVYSWALDPPKGDVVLTVTGDIDHPNIGKAAQFDLPMLEALKGRTATMETPWTTGEVKFSGPLLRAVLDAAGSHGKSIRLVALNDYSADIPLEDATRIDTMLATRMDGQAMSVRDKGPLFLIYPFDKDKTLYNEKYFSRSVWQIKTIETR